MTSPPSTHTPLTIGICGSTANTARCAESVRQDARFEILWCVTPPPRPVGRHQVETLSPFQTWAIKHEYPVMTVEKSLKEIRDELDVLQQKRPIDFLLVVDFGYLIPQWLLDLPKQAAVNIHPSELPKYRGSSPGQYALLFGETTTAVTIMRMEAGLDTGPIIAQIPFSVSPQETQESYYEHAFSIAEQHLPEVLIHYDPANELPQPEDSPTPIAQRFTKQDGFIPYEMLTAAHTADTAQQPVPPKWQKQLGEPLQRVLADQSLTIGEIVDRAVRAYYPWPGVWTLVPEYKGRTNVRQKILAVEKSAKNHHIEIVRWQYDGEKPKKIR